MTGLSASINFNKQGMNSFDTQHSQSVVQYLSTPLTYNCYKDNSFAY